MSSSLKLSRLSFPVLEMSARISSRESFAISFFSTASKSCSRCNGVILSGSAPLCFFWSSEGYDKSVSAIKTGLSEGAFLMACSKTASLVISSEVSFIRFLIFSLGISYFFSSSSISCFNSLGNFIALLMSSVTLMGETSVSG